MAGGEDAGVQEAAEGGPCTPSPYEEVLAFLSSLITRRTRADGANKGDRFDLMFDYLQMLDLEQPVSQLKVIHVAGTKGKGSTCTFTESILRSCGFRTGLFTSPHLIDVRERFRLDGVDISEEKFIAYFWWCWNRLQEKTNDDVPMPTYFRFLALLAFKIFTAEQVDVAILEVGLGGKFDATNVVQAPIVCGVSSLGYDHMEILGNTLGEIAGEKAGIFKKGVPAYTVPQPEEAMEALQNRASQLGIPLIVALPLDIGSLKGQKLGLDGEHQYANAGLAVALCRTWLQKTKQMERMYLDDNEIDLPEQFIRGLTVSSMQGRAQVVPDPYFSTQRQGSAIRGPLIFYLDGAHSPESMEMCAKWFSRVVKEDTQHKSSWEGRSHDDGNVKQILLFNCMSVRDPQLLLPRLVNACADNGVHFHKAIFVPSQSVLNKVGSYGIPADSPHVEVSWQLTLQRVWENLVAGGKDSVGEGIRDDHLNSVTDISHCTRSSVFASLPQAIKWLRDNTQQNQSTRFQEEHLQRPSFPSDLLPRLQTEDREALTHLFTEEEVRLVNFSSAGDKALGPDGFPMVFFQHCWEVVKQDFVAAVQKFHGAHLSGINKTFLVLIPKKGGVVSISDFRPISLVNSYKVISKLLARRLKGVLSYFIGDFHGAFIRGRHIQDNFLVVHECLYAMKQQRKKRLFSSLTLRTPMTGLAGSASSKPSITWIFHICGLIGSRNVSLRCPLRLLSMANPLLSSVVKGVETGILCLLFSSWWWLIFLIDCG